MSTESSFPIETQRYLAALVDLIRRTGSHQFQLRHQDDEQPVVWMAVALYPRKSAIPDLGSAGKSLRHRHLAECAAGLDPIVAVYRLAEQLVDGGECVHCRRITMLWESWQTPMPKRMAGHDICYHVYDPELATFTMSCKMHDPTR